MSAKKNSLNYSALVKNLRAEGPGRLYLLWGEEDYLRAQFLTELRRLCLPDGGNDFCDRRLDGSELDVSELRDSVDSLPFMSERSFIEVNGFELGSVRAPDLAAIEKIVADVPDYCTLVFTLTPGQAPDMRLRLNKAIKKHGFVIEFTAQDGSQLTRWIQRRFEALGKSISSAAANRLIFNSGDLMNGLIGEIEKIAAGTSGPSVEIQDVDRLSTKITTARVFDMTDRISALNFEGAAAILGDLLDSGEEPLVILAVIGGQMRNLYAARLAIDKKLGKPYVQKICGKPWLVDSLLRSARNFSSDSLADCCELCAKTDYTMKSSGVDSKDLLIDLLINMVVEAKGSAL